MLSLNRVIVLALLAIVGLTVWQVALPAQRQASSDVGNATVSLLDNRTEARFTVALVNLQTHHQATGSYDGAPMPEGATLVQADGASYCVQVGPPGTVSHVTGPGGSAAAGGC